MFGKSSIKELIFQSPEEKIYLLKLIAHQRLGSKWIYYRKIKKGDSGLKLFKEASLMEQMKATQAALRFTTKNARKLYRAAYQSTLKEIKAYTGLKTEFPELPDPPEGEALPSLNSTHDAVIITWTPLKFLLPVAQLRAKGLATQRHTEGLAAKLFFKVIGYYTDHRNWDQYKLNLYLRRITGTSSYQEIVKELEPLKSDLEKFMDAYELFKFGKASLSKDIATESDNFDDAMGVESFEAQLENLYWYHFIYAGMELFIFRYYLTLITSTTSADAVRYLTSIFEPVLHKAIENRVVFLGSFETDRSKRSFRVPYQKLLKFKEQESDKKNIKTQKGVFETYTYHLPLLEQSTTGHELTALPEKDSVWWTFIQHHLLNIGKPVLVPEEETEEITVDESPESNPFEAEKAHLIKERERLVGIKKELVARKKQLELKKSNLESLDKAQKIEFEEEKANLLNEELKFDKSSQKLKETYLALENRQKAAELVKKHKKQPLTLNFVDRESMLQFEKDLSHTELRKYVLMNLMSMMVQANQFKGMAKYQILERFKSRVQNDKELEAKRIEEIGKKAEKKLRELKKRKSKMERLKQSETINAVQSDIKDFEDGIKERIDIIKQDSEKELSDQRKRLNALFQDVSQEKSINLGATSKLVWKLVSTIEAEGEFYKGFPLFLSQSIQTNYTKELEPLYANLFNIFDLSIRDKVLIIQALDKSARDKGVRLSLDSGEEREFQKLLATAKESIEKQVPDLFTSKIIFLNKLIVVGDLFKLSLDSKSFNTLLLLKIASAKSTQSFNLNAETMKAMLELNKSMNPIPKNRIMQEGREKEKSPEKRINSAKINSLLDSLEG